MKNIFLPAFLLYLLAATSLAAQNLRPDVLSGGGQSLADASGSARLSFTIGETAIQTIAVSNDNMVCAQGFHSRAIGSSSLDNPGSAVAEPNRNPQGLLPTTATEGLDVAAWGLKVYPNPATQALVVEYSATDTNPTLDISLWDVHGRLVLDASRLLNGDTRRLDIQHIQVGIYLLRVLCSDGRVGVVRILKAE